MGGSTFELLAGITFTKNLEKLILLLFMGRKKCRRGQKAKSKEK